MSKVGDSVYLKDCPGKPKHTQLQAQAKPQKVFPHPGAKSMTKQLTDSREYIKR